MVIRMLPGEKNQNSQPSHGSGGISIATSLRMPPASGNRHQLPETNHHSFRTMIVFLQWHLLSCCENKPTKTQPDQLHHCITQQWQKALAVLRNDNNGTLHEAQCQCCGMTCHRAAPWHGEKCCGMLLHQGTKKTLQHNVKQSHQCHSPKKCHGMLHNTIANAAAHRKMPMQLPTPQHEVHTAV